MKQKNWKELPHAGTILEAGNANEYKTGSWRSLKPRWIEENCIQCLFCWIYCPDSAVLVKDEKMIGYDYNRLVAGDRHGLGRCHAHVICPPLP